MTPFGGKSENLKKGWKYGVWCRGRSYQKGAGEDGALAIFLGNIFQDSVDIS